MNQLQDLKLKPGDMQVKSKFLSYLHLDQSFSLLTAKNTRLVFEYFKCLDVHQKGKLNDIQFCQFMKQITDLDKKRIMLAMDMLDREATGYIAFEQFFLLLCILIALQDHVEKQFIFRHSKLVFDMLDADGSGTISADEFGQYGFLFNLKDHSVQKVFFEFDVSGDEELDYKEFKMFAMACIDKQKDLEMKAIAKMKEKSKRN